VLVEVGLWQWRIAFTGRGRKVPGALLGSIGAVLQVTSILDERLSRARGCPRAGALG
jgi:hypothetical protein